MTFAAKSVVVSFFEWFGELTTFAGQVLRSIFRPPYEIREFLRHCDNIGPKSVPLVMMAGGATGVVMALQMGDSLTRLGASSTLPTVIVFSMIRETGPMITSLVVNGRIAAGIGAELGAMKVTEQIDAMEASAVNPYKYLAFTRILACILMLPLLTVLADFCGIVMGWFTRTMSQPISFRLFIETGFKGSEFNDLLPPTFKTAIFGLIIGLVSSYQGMKTRGGTEGVGRSVTSAVVISSLLIVISDVVLVRIIQVFFS